MLSTLYRIRVGKKDTKLHNKGKNVKVKVKKKGVGKGLGHSRRDRRGERTIFDTIMFGGDKR